MEDKAKTKRWTCDPGFKDRAVQMASESRNIAETPRQLGVGYSLLNVAYGIRDEECMRLNPPTETLSKWNQRQVLTAKTAEG